MIEPPAEYHDRLSQVHKQMDKRGISLLLMWGEPHGSYGLLSAPNDIGFLTNWSIKHPDIGGAVMALPRKEEPRIFATGPLHSTTQIKDTLVVGQLHRIQRSSLPDKLREISRTHNVDHSEIGVVRREELPVWLDNAIGQAFDRSTLVDATSIIDQLRLVKSDQQIDSLRQSADVTDLMFDELTDRIIPGTEITPVLARIEYEAQLAGAEFVTTWAAHGEFGGDQLVMDPKGKTGTIEENQVLTVGVHLVKDNYWGHAIRMGVVGKPTESQETIFNTIREAQALMIEHAKPGVKLSDLHNKLESYYATTEFSNCFRSLHGLGLRYGGSPRFPQPGSSFPAQETALELKPGMVFECHPNIWNGPKGNTLAAIGDMLVVRDSGPELLTTFPRSLQRY